jgi:hypothetical protein
MRTNLKLFVGIGLLLLGCKKENEGFDAGGPITRYLTGRWQLEKVVSPSGTKTGSQIGYEEIFQHGNDNVENYDKVFRNGSLASTYTWLRSPSPVSNAQDMTMIISYWEGSKKQYFKIRQDATKSALEASGYIDQIGSSQDTVRYHYVRI